jgi:hypothetical protein
MIEKNVLFHPLPSSFILSCPLPSSPILSCPLWVITNEGVPWHALID